MSSDQNALDELCAWLGLAPEYIDGWGHRQHASEATRRSLIGAMGLDASTDGAAATTLQALRQSDSTRTLPPSIVVRQGSSPVRVPVNMPGNFADSRMTWRLDCEQGERFGGVFRPADLGVQATNERSSFMLELGMALPMGYHTLELREAGAEETLATMSVIVCPETCYEPPVLARGGRIWGPVVQIYALRSARNWGVGDYSDLRRVLEMSAVAGAHFVGVSPLHALFPHEPQRASPYSPSTRNWLNTLYLDVEYIADFAECEEARARVASAEFQSRLAALRELELIDYAGVGALKREITRKLYQHFRRAHLEAGTRRAQQFRVFQRTHGKSLRMHALCEALQEYFHDQDPSIWGWTVWPHDWRDCESEQVHQWARANEERVEYFEYMQWQAELQLAAIAQRAESVGMVVGLYRDLAVGVNEGGSDTWMRPSLYAKQVSVGAPPEEFNLTGQEWGLPPQIPHRMREEGFITFIETLRANMRHAGALRLDHVMGLLRLYWVPPKVGATQGAYMMYPFDDLVGILALESWRNKCLIIGEDLGTVPEEIRYGMSSQHMLSYRPLYFQHAWDGSFVPPGQWPGQALVAVSTHDLPTLRGFWTGFDLELRHALNLFPTEKLRGDQIASRAHDRVQLLLALQREGLLPEGVPADPQQVPDMDERLSRAVHAYIARTPARLMGVQLEDIFGQIEQVNVPSTTEERHPNWQRKISVALDDFAADGRALAMAEAILRERRSPVKTADRLGELPLESARIPRATYRLQFHRDFRFEDAERIAPYLAALGVSHMYASPYFQARPGSTHGYDIVDHDALNPEIGDDASFNRMCDALAANGLEQLLDTVPNHVGVMGAHNAWWLDVLENGQASQHAAAFDIDWSPPEPELKGKVLLPVLGDQYGKVLEAGQLKLVFDDADGRFVLHYFQHRFPIDPSTYPVIMNAAPGEADSDASRQAMHEYEALAGSFGYLPTRDVAETERIAERQRDKDIHQRRLAEIVSRSSAVRRRIDDCLRELNGRAGEPASFDALDALIRIQPYRLAYWRVAADDINYRRFFDINDLAALRMENEAVFEATHRTIFDWLAKGRVAGLRIDHPDGLYDPARYFERLQSRYQEVMREAAPHEPPRALYLVIEKILAEYERLPQRWPVHGGVGYSFANLVNGLFVDGTAESRFDRLYAAFIGERVPYEQILYESKLLIMMHSLAAELNVLTSALHRIAQSDRHTCDFTRNRLRSALMEVTAAFPVYRTYITEEGASDEDRRYIDWAVAGAKRHGHAGEISVIDFLRKVLLGAPREPDAARRNAMLAFVGRFQQFTAPVMAKSMEDTSFYRYNRLVSLNDVGGDPRTFGVSINAFHAACQYRARYRPHSLVGTSTHDSKRSEDVRARLDVLSEMPGAWRLSLRRWSRITQRRRTFVDDAPAPSRNDEYLFYQSLAGIWPDGPIDDAALEDVRTRMRAYMLKAAREAKEHTSWINPDEQYEAALAQFVDGLLGALEPNPFLSDFAPLAQRITRFGYYNSLSMTLLKFTAPGVPDIYQGCETWAFNLVDPDNRRPVDHAGLAERLAGLQRSFASGGNEGGLRELCSSMADGRIKQYVVWQALQLRARQPMLFERGRYSALPAHGQAAAHVVAFARAFEDEVAITVASRLLYKLCGGEEAAIAEASTWGDTVVELNPLLTAHAYVDLLSGRRFETVPFGSRRALRVAQLFGILPMALLVPAQGQ
ncbi:malto-oligosyltrehalose synthase [Uliginosibacterium sp. sgz301328]|uniref:malto-oligosyltrehalose synthase n=1 Tax=Uliginosibacterium sp. sgz301328 TaxID=3243764 RepID=UPI00359D694B